MAFDPGAVVDLLVRGYPLITSAELARAAAEHPDVFGNGVIFGTKGDKLKLPDGRAYDCIVNAGLPVAQRRWSCALIDPNAPGGDDAFALEPGPLTLLEPVPFTPRDPDAFQSLVARELGQLGDWEGAYDAARSAAIPADAETGDGGDDPELVQWAAELVAAGQQTGDFLPTDELGAIDGISPSIDQGAANVTDDPAGLTPDAPDLPPYNPPPDNAPPGEPTNPVQ